MSITNSSSGYPTVGMAAYSPTGPHRRMTFQRRALGPKDVAIKIHFGTICHSDIHTIHGDWGPVTFPQIVGHEITGTVVEVGASASKFAVGARVGTMVNSCGTCTECQAGHENYCLNGNVQTYASRDRDGTITQGGYSTFIVVDEDFVVRVPDAVDLAAAAPLSARASPSIRRSGIEA
jgi:alcohol dehydrogenase (NADP+)